MQASDGARPLWPSVGRYGAPFKFVGMDKGSECMGAGKGKKWATLRAALMGKGGPLEEIFCTRRAVHAALDGEHGPLLDRAMQFLGTDGRRNMGLYLTGQCSFLEPTIEGTCFLCDLFQSDRIQVSQ
jgi:hypothetical protein